MNLFIILNVLSNLRLLNFEINKKKSKRKENEKRVKYEILHRDNI